MSSTIYGMKKKNPPEAPKRGRGRPRIKNGARHTTLLKHTKEQKEDWKRKAERAGLSFSVWAKKRLDEAPE